MIRGIGPTYAKKMVKAFGEKVFDVIEAEPDRLRDVDGIGPVRAQRIAAAWAEQKIVREIMVFLHSHGVGTARAVRIYKTYGADAIQVQVMTENPYRLARDIRGIGCKTADVIAIRLGVEKTAMIRVRAGISYALTEAMDEGHCGLPTEQLVPLAVDLLEVPKELVEAALELELAEGTVIADRVDATDCVFLGGLYRAEQVVAERVRRLVNGTLPWPSIDPEKALPWIERKTGLLLAESQIAAIRLALTSKVLVITGGPGVGKTTIVNAILRILAAKSVDLLLCAPTGRAAKRMTTSRFRPAGRRMLEPANLQALQAVLFHITMWHFDLENLGWGLHGWPQCDAGVVLWSLAIAANDWQARERLSRLCTIPINGVLDQTWDTASHAMEARILRPLKWFGLLEHREDGTESSRFERRHLYRKTALFDRFLSFDVQLEDTGVPRH